MSLNSQARKYIYHLHVQRLNDSEQAVSCCLLIPSAGSVGGGIEEEPRGCRGNVPTAT